MATKLLVIFAILGATVIGLASEKSGSSPQINQSPVIVANIKMRGITQGIPTTTVFRPTTTGVYRASFYLAMTTPGGNSSQDARVLNLNWTDDAGPETIQLGYVSSSAVPPFAYEQNPNGEAGMVSPWVFEAVAGQPITVSLSAFGDQPGTCGLAMTIERLQ